MYTLKAMFSTLNNVNFSEDIQPLLSTHCEGCHSGPVPSGGIDLSLYDGVKITADNGSSPLKIRGFRSQGRNLQVAFEGLQSREETEHLIGELVGVDGNSLPALPQGQFYWRDLIGLKVLDSNGRTLGTVQEMMETGANDVAVVSAEERNEEILIPWVEEVITQVDLENGQVMVDWDPDY